MYTIEQLNHMSQQEWVAVLGAVFEDTPMIAEQAWQLRPFVDREVLHQQMVNLVQAMSRQQQLALIQAHPDLGSKAKMADASVQEQTGAGLTQLTPTEYAQLQALNESYKAKFGFPFILAVRHHSKASILASFQQRLHNSIEAEWQQALAEIAMIAQLRLHQIVAPSYPR